MSHAPFKIEWTEVQWQEWYRMTPQGRLDLSGFFFAEYVRTGGSLDPDPDPDDPYDFVFHPDLHPDDPS